LPKDARTILQTCPDKVAAQTVAGGLYYHFGLANGLGNILDEFGVEDDSVIKLQINIDGLPIFKSTNSQFWPILGLLTNCVKREPFVIGLFYGNSKPDDDDVFCPIVRQPRFY